MAENQCPIWGTPAEVIRGDGGARVESDRTDGTYRITDEAEEALAELDGAGRARLTTWLVDRRRFGEPRPLLTRQLVLDAKQRRRLRVAEKIDRFFLWLHSRQIDLDFTLTRPAYLRPPERHWMMAWTECARGDELEGLVTQMLQMGYLLSSGSARLIVSPAGWEKLEGLDRTNIDSPQGFVAMWFDPVMGEAADAIERAVRGAGYQHMRINQKDHNNDITDEIISEIRRSRFVVADATCEIITNETGLEKGISRAGVYYEAGFARGLDIPVFWTCREDCMPFVHFDTRQLNHIDWSNPQNLEERLTKRITAVLGDGPNRS